MRINVVDNISKYFGVEPWWYYINDIREYLTYTGLIFKFQILGLSLCTMYQAHGLVPLRKEQKESF